MQHGKWDIKWVLIDPWSSVNVLFLGAFQKLELDPNDVQMFSGSLMGLSSEHVQVISHLIQETTYDEGANSKAIDFNNLIMDAMSPYIIILGRPAINTLRVIVSTIYLTLKYPIPDGRVGIVRGDQLIARECYQNSLAITREELSLLIASIMKFKILISRVRTPYWVRRRRGSHPQRIWMSSI